MFVLHMTFFKNIFFVNIDTATLSDTEYTHCYAIKLTETDVYEKKNGQAVKFEKLKYRIEYWVCLLP